MGPHGRQQRVSGGRSTSTAPGSPRKPEAPGHRGRGFYAAQTYSDLPATDGRRIQIGWFQTETKGMPFNQSMTLPMELKLTATADGARLTWTPVRELASLRGRQHVVRPAPSSPTPRIPSADVRAELVELRAEFEAGTATEVAFGMRGASIRYDARKQELAVNDLRAPARSATDASAWSSTPTAPASRSSPATASPTSPCRSNPSPPISPSPSRPRAARPG